ncbi:MAG: glycosyltransferase family 4 protein [Bacteroidetes bacterium]|nr:glycosyltransferase family 4 protein [Bacteroidota bacterium]
MFSRNIFSAAKNEVEIVAFDIPYPPNYGGVIDVFYKIKAFKRAGIKVNLHCFEYGRKPSPELEALCEKVTYYQRKITKTNLFRRRPYIVVTRNSEDLIKNLCKNNNPILFEGLHTCFYLDDKKVKRRKMIVRTHNIEHYYYQNLAKVEKEIFKKYYFYNEAQKLRRYEKILESSSGIAAISIHDGDYFTKKYKKTKVKVVSAFHPNEEIDIKEGLGNYALYHGSLAVGENNEAALYLVEEVFNDLDIPLIIAGNKPSKELRDAVAKHSNITLKTDISTIEIYKLIKDAQINVLPTFQATGIKLKLLAALYTGRHCIVNAPMVEDTGLEKLCIIKPSAIEMKEAVKEMMKIPFGSHDISKRKRALNDSIYSNNYNINQLIEMLFS